MAVQQALPAATLTRLEVEDCTVALAGVLPQLTNLRTLQIDALKTECQDIGVCMPALSRLSRLTKLTVMKASRFNMQQLPVQLQVGFAKDNKMSIIGLTALVQLQRLTLQNMVDSRPAVLAVCALPCLTHLGLAYRSWTTAAEAPWTHIPMLQKLSVSQFQPHPDYSAPMLMGFMHQAATNTGLTKLQIAGMVSGGVVEGLYEQPAFALCQHIAKLTNLVDLRMLFILQRSVVCASGNAQHLSSLTKLTQLHLECIHDAPCGETPFVTDTAVVSLARSLNQLEESSSLCK